MGDCLDSDLFSRTLTLEGEKNNINKDKNKVKVKIAGTGDWAIGRKGNFKEIIKNIKMEEGSVNEEIETR